MVPGIPGSAVALRRAMSKKLVCPQCQCELEFSLFTSGISQEIRCSSCGASLSWDASRKAVRKDEEPVAPSDATQLEARRAKSIMSAKTAIDPQARRALKAASAAKPPDPGAGEAGPGEGSAAGSGAHGSGAGSGSAAAPSAAEVK